MSATTGPALDWERPAAALRRAARDVALAAALVLPVLGVAEVGSRGPAVATLNLGPNDASYLRGFQAEVEIEGERALHWSRHDAEIDLPLWVQGQDLQLAMRFERIVAAPARVRVFVNHRLVAAFVCRGEEGVQVRRLSFSSPGGEPLGVGLSVDGDDRRDLGLRFDWVSVAVGPHGRIGLDRGPALELALLVGVFFALLRLSGATRWQAIGMLAPVSVGIALWAFLDPLTVAHLALKLAWPAMVLAALAALMVRRHPWGRWALACFMMAFLLKGGGVFHPRFFYPDVQVHRRFMYEMRGASGTLAERGRAAQRKLHQAYRVVGAERGYNFPYSPLFHAPFMLVRWRGPESVDDAMRYVGVVVSAMDVFVLFWLGAWLVSGRVGALAALLVALMPVAYSRLLYAMWPTIVGHLGDLIVIVAAASCLRAPERKSRWLWLLLAATVACLLYVGSLFTLTAFLAALAVVERRHAWRFLGVALVAGCVTVALLYLPFVVTLVRDIAPAVSRGAGLSGGTEEGSGPFGALARVPLFFGWIYPCLAVGGLVAAYRRSSRVTWQLLLAGALAHAGLLVLRALPSGIFRDVKESTFAAPFFALAAAVVIDECITRLRHGRWVAALIVSVLAVFGLARYAEYIASYGAPAVAVVRDVPAPPAE